MADFDRAIEKLLKNEGGYSNDSDDKGGATNYGLTIPFLKDFGYSYDSEKIKGISKEFAITIYKQLWKKSKSDEIRNNRLASYYFDCVVNHGQTQAVKFLQRALLACGKDIDDDGKIGAVTISKANSVEIEQLSIWCCMKAIRADFMRMLSKKEGQEKFLKGWLNRVYEKL